MLLLCKVLPVKYYLKGGDFAANQRLDLSQREHKDYLCNIIVTKCTNVNMTLYGMYKRKTINGFGQEKSLRFKFTHVYIHALLNSDFRLHAVTKFKFILICI